MTQKKNLYFPAYEMLIIFHKYLLAYLTITLTFIKGFNSMNISSSFNMTFSPITKIRLHFILYPEMVIHVHKRDS